MKKSLAFIIILCMSLCLLCSCGINAGTTAASTTGQQSCIGFQVDIVDSICEYSIDGFIDKIKSSDKAFAAAIKNEGFLYYPEPTESVYKLVDVCGVIYGDGEVCIDYYFENKSEEYLYGQYFISIL